MLVRLGRDCSKVIKVHVLSPHSMPRHQQDRHFSEKSRAIVAPRRIGLFTSSCCYPSRDLRTRRFSQSHIQAPISTSYVRIVLVSPWIDSQKLSSMAQSVLTRKTGVIVGDDVLKLFNYAQEKEFAIPAIVSIKAPA